MKFYYLDTFRTYKPAATGMESFAVEPNIADEVLIRCSKCRGGLGSLPWLPPFRVELVVVGRSYGDIVSASGNDWLISDRLRELIVTHRISGLEGFEPVQIVRIVSTKRIARSLGDPPQYYRVAPKLNNAAIDDGASELLREPPEVCQVCRCGKGLIKRWKRVVFEPGTWSGEDVFVARGFPGACFVSERFRDMCLDNDVTNAIFVSADEYWHDFYPWENTERANEVLAMPSGPMIQDKHTQNGDFVRYIESRNECLIRHQDGTIELFFPVDGPEFFDRLK